jgi:hypothetical protein
MKLLPGRYGTPAIAFYDLLIKLIRIRVLGLQACRLDTSQVITFHGIFNVSLFTLS